MLDLFQGSEKTMKNPADTNRDDFSTFKQDAQDEFNKIGRMIETVKDDIVNFKKERFREVGEFNRGMEKMESAIEVLKEDTTELKVNFARLQGQTHNRSVHNPYIRITPVVAYQPGKGMVEPEFFPKTAHEFFKLKRPNIAQERNALLYLVKFYDIQGYQTWGQADFETHNDGSANIRTSVEDNSSQESETHSDGSADIRASVEDNSSQESQSLQDAVEMYPHIAVEALAAIVGLVEDNFIRFRTRAAEFNQRPKRPATKRLQGKLQVPEKTKRQRPLEKQPIVPDERNIPFHKFNLSQGSEDTSKAPTELTRLEWDYGPEPMGPKLTVNNLGEDKFWFEQKIDHSESPTEHG